MNSPNFYEGLSSTSVKVFDRMVECRFTRDNSNPNPKYFDLNSEKLYLIVAYGEIDKEGMITLIKLRIKFQKIL